MSQIPDAVIIGGGVLGTALAYELTRRTMRVVLLETGALARGATGNGFAWINATSKWEDAAYHHLNAKGMAHYETLANGYGAASLGLYGGGALFVAAGSDSAGIQQLRQRAALLQSWNYPAVLLTQAEMQVMEPKARFPDGAEGLFAPADKWVDTLRLTRFFVDRAGERNGTVRRHCAATGFTVGVSGKISTVHTVENPLATPLLILAAGIQTPSLVAQILNCPEAAASFPLRRVPGLLVETPPNSASEHLHRILYPVDAGGLHLRPTPQGGLLLGADDTDALLSADDNTIPNDTAPHLLQRIASALPMLPLASLMQSATPRLCVRPVPADGLPIVGPLPGVGNVYVAVTHSGVTLGPLLAQLLAEEIATGRVPPLLAPYRLDRFPSLQGINTG